MLEITIMIKNENENKTDKGKIIIQLRSPNVRAQDTYVGETRMDIKSDRLGNN